jgi:hypothetical protein
MAEGNRWATPLDAFYSHKPAEGKHSMAKMLCGSHDPAMTCLNESPGEPLQTTVKVSYRQDMAFIRGEVGLLHPQSAHVWLCPLHLAPLMRLTPGHDALTQ